MNKAIILGVFSLWIQRVNSINASPHPHTYTQPDGTAITVVGHGDESSHWESDLQAFTILEDDKGYIVYAEETAEGKLIPSSERVGKPHPKTMKKDLQDHGPHDCSREVCGGLEAQIMAHEKMPLDDLGERRRRLLENDPGPKVHGRRAVATTGTLKNLVVLLRFNDHHSRNLPSVADIEVLMNSNDPHPILAPTGSLKGVFLENSYGQLSIESTVMPWLLMPRTEAYYADGVSG